MDSVSSIIDGSMAIAGAIAALVGTGWALMASESTTTVERTTGDDVVPTTLKKVA